MHYLHIPGMACGGCLGAVSKALQKLDPQTHIESDLKKRTISVSSGQTEGSILTALKNAGYPAQPISAGH
ncbi:heavy-metal-associated domain-containing protein [Microvirga solisilvae]|uniref:heavy-metal-associated domain-containing protein n=1 Tax=Microvirga solisilvae TaxID=2919498 RepID=UPI001FB0012D|nr:heavy-metal-associated domain-containing protein [Microvirga solisilvae]